MQKGRRIVRTDHSLRNRDKMKDDAISHLSDQLVAITARLQELERIQITIYIFQHKKERKADNPGVHIVVFY